LVSVYSAYGLITNFTLSILKTGHLGIGVKKMPTESQIEELMQVIDRNVTVRGDTRYKIAKALIRAGYRKQKLKQIAGRISRSYNDENNNTV
jgi:hypothetical protein